MKALVLSGGGSKGAYQVGALMWLLRERDHEYQIISGTSVGALNGAWLAQYGPGKGAEAALALQNLWHEIDNDKIWQKWYWGLLGPLPAFMPKWLGGKQSVYSTKPLRELVTKKLRPKAIRDSGKLLRVGAVSLTTGKSRVWTEKDVADMAKAVLASSAFPMFFEPVRVGSELYTDHGVRETTPIEQAIMAGATEIDVITTGPAKVIGKFDNRAKGLAIVQSTLDAMNAEIETWDRKAAELLNALVDLGQAPPHVRKVTITTLDPNAAKKSLGDPLDFNPRQIRANINRGYEDASKLWK